MLEQSFIDEMKQKLLDEKKELESKLSEITKYEEGVENPDMDDTSNDARDDILEDSMQEHYEKILSKIEGALKRIDEGTYGICVSTGKEIRKERLEIEPWAEKATK